MQATKWFLAAAFVAAAFSSAFASKIPNVDLPDWMQQAAARPLGTYTSDTNAVVLLDQISVRVLSADQYVEHRRVVVKILRPEGRGESVVQTPLLSQKDKPSDLHAWSIDSAGHKYEVKNKEFVATTPNQEDLYNDEILYATKVPGGEVGTIVGFEYDILNHIYLDEYDWVPQGELPVRDASLTIELPPSWEYKSVWANSTNLQAQSIGPNQWKWSLSDIPPIEDEPLRRSIYALAKRLEIVYYGPGISPSSGSWANIGSWYKSLADPRRISTPEIHSAAEAITANASGFDARVRAVASYLQSDVRYVAIQIGIGGHQPHFASDIFRHKYGDCKDKAALMATLLAELGYRSEMVLVDTERGKVKPDVPCVCFNHAILAIELPSSVPADTYPSEVKTKSGVRYVIFDPTNSHTPFGQIPFYEQDSYALITTSPGELVHLPLVRSEISGNDTAGKFTLSSDGVLSGGVIQKVKGESASRMRMALGEFDGKDRSKLLEIVASYSLKQVNLESPEFENLKTIDKDLIVKYRLTMNGYAQHAGALLLVRPRVIGDKALDLPNKKRRYDLQLATAHHDRDVYEITLPSGYIVDELPDNTHIDVGFAKYDAKIESVGNVVRYTREYEIRDPYIELSKISDVKRLESAIAADQSATVVLKKAP